MAKEFSSKSLSEVNQSVDVNNRKNPWGRFLAFLGPAYLVSVGYMDPGNWATDIAGGSRFGYALIWVLLMSNLMALLLQSLSARLGVVTGLDLAQASRASYSKPVNFFLYLLAEIAIAACDLAEVIGMAIGLNLLFHIPLLLGVCISVFDTFLLLLLMNLGIRKIEAFIISLVTIIGLSFFIEMLIAQPSLVDISKGFIPSLPGDTALYIAIGIIGATVMPHNLYLHSSLVQTRKFGKTAPEIKRAIKFNVIDSAIALNLALFVNAAILILAAATFFKNGMYNVAEIQDAHHFLEPMLGSSLAPILFAVALILAGQSSTITGTLAGQIVMEGYLNLRIQLWIRRLLTRVIAIIPAVITIVLLGEGSTGEMLVLSQVILSLQLGFAIIPLIHFVSDKERMGEFAIGIKIKMLAWLFATIIVSLNVKLVGEQIAGWLADAGPNAWILYLTVVPIAFGAGMLLLFITFKPLFSKSKFKAITPHGEVPPIEILKAKKYERVAVTVDFSAMDSPAINAALAQGGKEAQYCLIHIVETAGAMVLGSEITDHETNTDLKNLNDYVKDLQAKGYSFVLKLGYGNPKKVIPQLVKEFNSEILVMGAHGHKTFMDLILGTTVDGVRHKLDIPVFIVRNKG